MFLYNKPNNLEKVSQFPQKYKVTKLSKDGNQKNLITIKGEFLIRASK